MSLPTIRAVVAARISKLTDATTSPESQVTNARAYAEARGWTVVGEAADLDVSASVVGPWEREELGAWLRKPHEFDALVFRSIDRLARRAGDFYRLIEWADEHSIKLVCLNPNIDFTDDIGRLIASVLAHVAEMEAKTIRERVRGARRFMRNTARWPAGMPPYGYRLCPHPSGSGYALEPDPEHSAILDEIIEKVLDSEAVNAIVADLNRRGVPTPQTRAKKPGERRAAKRPARVEPPRWQTTNLLRLLRSESLRGYVRHKGALVLDKDGEPVRYGPALVDDDTWHALQAELSTRKDPNQRKVRGRALLVGVAFCGVCGGPLYITGSDSRGATKRYRYGCVAARFGKPCSSPSIYADAIEKFAEREFLSRFGRMQVVERIEIAARDNRAEIADVEKRLSRLRDDREAGLYDDETGRADYAIRVKALQARLSTLRDTQTSAPSVREVETGYRYGEVWRKATTDDDRRQILLSNGARVNLAAGKSGSRDWESRLTFESRRFTDEQLAEQGHDEINPDW